MNILNLTLLCNFFRKIFALGFTKFPLDKRNSRLEFITVLIKLSDMKCCLGVNLYTCNCNRESAQFYDASTACFNLFGNIPSGAIKQEIPCISVELFPVFVVMLLSLHLSDEDAFWGTVSKLNLGGERLVSHSRRFTPNKRTPGIKWWGYSVGPRSVWTRWHTERLLYLPGIEPRPSRFS